MSSNGLLASDASRPLLRSGILTPASDDSMETAARDGLPDVSKKRKAEDVQPPAPKRQKGYTHSLAMEELLKPSIVVKVGLALAYLSASVLHVV